MDACAFVLFFIVVGVIAGVFQLITGTAKQNTSYKLGAGIGRKTRKLYDWIVDEEKK